MQVRSPDAVVDGSSVGIGASPQPIRSSLFTRIVPIVKDIGLWGDKIRAGYTEMGVAAAVGPASKMGLYWVQEFGTPR